MIEKTFPSTLGICFVAISVLLVFGFGLMSGYLFISFVFYNIRVYAVWGIKHFMIMSTVDKSQLMLAQQPSKC